MDSNRDMSKTVTVPGELHSAATGNIVAAAEEIFDYKTNSYQSDLNRDSLSYNVSAHNGNKVYTFDEAVRLVPEEFRVGGLKLTFISDSSDNKYVQYRCKTQLFSINSEDWAFERNDTLVESETFDWVLADRNGHIAIAVKLDGSIYFGAGCPLQISRIPISIVNCHNINKV